MNKNRHYPTLGIWLLLASCGSGPDEPAQQTSAGQETRKATSSDETDQLSDNALVGAGKAAFANCIACHNIDDEAGAEIGPNLAAVVGRKAGTEEGFAYSSALKSSGITWTEAELDTFLTNPTARVSGTNMKAGAVSDSTKRKAIIAYLKDAAAD